MSSRLQNAAVEILEANVARLEADLARVQQEVVVSQEAVHKFVSAAGQLLKTQSSLEARCARLTEALKLLLTDCREDYSDAPSALSVQQDRINQAFKALDAATGAG